MVIAVITVRVMKMTVYQIVDVVTVGDSFVATARAMNMI